MRVGRLLNQVEQLPSTLLPTNAVAGLRGEFGDKKLSVLGDLTNADLVLPVSRMPGFLEVALTGDVYRLPNDVAHLSRQARYRPPTVTGGGLTDPVLAESGGHYGDLIDGDLALQVHAGDIEVGTIIVVLIDECAGAFERAASEVERHAALQIWFCFSQQLGEYSRNHYHLGPILRLRLIISRRALRSR